MSLMRLLTATRSISDVKNEPSPYRMSQAGQLPKFGPRKTAVPAEAGGAKENLGEGNGDRTDAGCSLKSDSSRKPKAGWWQKLFRRQPRREARGPVQAEFTLDLVKVVRNDLSDAEEARDAERGARNKDKMKLEPRQEQEGVCGAPVR